MQHARELVELAALVAVHGPRLIRGGKISESALEEYWSASKTRLDDWSQALASYAKSQQAATEFLSNEAALILAWRTIRPIVVEILLSEVVTRVWTGVACAVDRAQGQSSVTPIVRSVYVGHQESRNRALHLMVYGRGFNTQEAVELNRLRRRSERWCDMLLAYILGGPELEEFAFEPQRTRDFAHDLTEELKRPWGHMGWQLVLSSLQAAFHQVDDVSPPSPVCNERIAAAILSCFPGAMFDSTGVLSSLWLDRIQHLSSDAEGMIDELLHLHGELPPPRTGRFSRI